MKTVHALLLLSTISQCVTESFVWSESTLVLLNVLFRHGNRTPDDTESYPEDPYRNNTYYPIGRGELTNKGKRREYSVGAELRKMYNSFLKQYYDPTILYARSTDYNRTKASLQLVLASLYPPKKEEIWLEGFNWQPIPTYYKPLEIDYLLASPAVNCPKYKRDYDNYQGSSTVMATNENNRQLYQYLSKHTGWNVTNPYPVYLLYFDLFAEQDLGLVLPDWTKSVWPEPITKVAIEEYYIETGTTTMKRYCGRLLKQIIDNSLEKIKGTLQPNRRIFLYSAHENNVAYLLILLKVFWPHVPSYGAHVIFELHKLKETYAFRIISQDYSNRNGPKVLIVPDCEEYCPIDRFIGLVRDVLPTAQDVCN